MMASSPTNVDLHGMPFPDCPRRCDGCHPMIRSLTRPLPLITFRLARDVPRLPAACAKFFTQALLPTIPWALSSRRCATRLAYTASWT
eukprot:547673-Hanusia_phi.AAC.1